MILYQLKGSDRLDNFKVDMFYDIGLKHRKLLELLVKFFVPHLVKCFVAYCTID